MTTTRLGVVSYLNTLPLIDGLEKSQGLSLVPLVPSRIVGLLTGPPGSENRVDAGLISVIDALRAPEPVVLIPAGMIGCAGPTLTVRLFSQKPIDRTTRVHADRESHTSVALCRVLLNRLHGLTPELVSFDARERLGKGRDSEEWPETVLLIGDKVVTDSPPAVRYPHQLDLGEAWFALTGLPFMYAVWMARASDLATDEGRRRLSTLGALLDRQRRHNQTRIDWVVSRSATERRWPADLARAYVGTLLSYEVTDAARAGLSRFYDDARTLGIVPADAPSPEWFDWRTTATSSATTTVRAGV